MRMKFLLGSIVHNCIIHPMFPIADLFDVLGVRFVGDVIDALHSRVDYMKYEPRSVKLPEWMLIQGHKYYGINEKKYHYGTAPSDVHKKS